MAAVIRSCIPFTKLRALICAVMAAGTGCALALFSSLLELQTVTLPMGLYVLSGGALCLIFAMVLDRIRFLFLFSRIRGRRFRQKILLPPRLYETVFRICISES